MMAVRREKGRKVPHAKAVDGFLHFLRLLQSFSIRSTFHVQLAQRWNGEGARSGLWAFKCLVLEKRKNVG